MMQHLIIYALLTSFAIFMAYQLGYEVAKTQWKDKSYWEGYDDAKERWKRNE